MLGILPGMIAKPLQIFRAGTQTDSLGRTLTFRAADLVATANAYDPTLHEAPLVVGHPETNAPAYGWAKSLAFEADALEATPQHVDAAFAEMVNQGRFKKISASFWMPDAPNNPVPGVYYLRHVGFLGAAAPAVKGLRTPSFSDETHGIVTIEFSTQEPTMADNTTDFAAREAALVKTEAELKAKADAQTADFAARDKALRAREDAIAKAEAKAQRNAAAEFAEAQAKAGRILPRQQAGLTELLLALPATALEFAEGDGTTAKIEPRTWLEKFVSELPPQIDYAERTAATDETKPPAGALSRKAFERLDPQQRKAHLARGGKIVD